MFFIMLISFVFFFLLLFKFDVWDQFCAGCWKCSYSQLFFIFRYNWESLCHCIQQCCSTFPMPMTRTLIFCTNLFLMHTFIIFSMLFGWVTNAKLQDRRLWIFASYICSHGGGSVSFFFNAFECFFFLSFCDTGDSFHPTANVRFC